ncbi:putative cytochrome P450 [Nemania sp. FL0031]|nr:putative cytochrome P450 [Nemania sp. FL0031]
MIDYTVASAVLLFSLALYSIGDMLSTWKHAKRQKEHAFIGSPTVYTPRFILNLMFAARASRIVSQGYQKFKTRSFQVIRDEGSVVVLPLSVLEELSTLPTSVASPYGALEHDLLGRYTGLDFILESRLHHSIVQRKLTPHLDSMSARLEQELSTAFKEYFPPVQEDWVEFNPYQVFAKISARMTAEVIVGPAFSKDPAWLGIAVNYTESLFKTVVILRLFPSWMRPFISYLLPRSWNGRRYIAIAKKLLSPKIKELLEKSDVGCLDPQIHSNDFNVLGWLANLAKGRERQPDNIAHTEVLLALASVHTTLLRIVNVLYDLTAHPKLFEELEEEVMEVMASSKQWSGPYDKLMKLDSVLRESQRTSPPTTLGMKRRFKKSHTFRNGLHVSEGTYVCLPTFAIENDPENTLNPETYDGLRSYRKRIQKLNNGESQDSKVLQFASGNDFTALNFGYGKWACPGRYFASMIIKMLFVKLVTEYDFKFLPGRSRPRNIEMHEFLFVLPWERLLVKRKPSGVCPFS